MAARIRTIKPEFWQSENVARCSLLARLLFLGLVSNADDDGRLRGAPAIVRATVFPYDEITLDEVSRALDELSTRALAVLYTVDGDHYIALPGWHKHQRIDRPSKSTLPPPPAIGDDGDTPTPSSASNAREASIDAASRGAAKSDAKRDSTKAREPSSNARRILDEASSTDLDQERDLDLERSQPAASCAPARAPARGGGGFHPSQIADPAERLAALRSLLPPQQAPDPPPDNHAQVVRLAGSSSNHLRTA